MVDETESTEQQDGFDALDAAQNDTPVELPQEEVKPDEQEEAQEDKEGKEEGLVAEDTKPDNDTGDREPEHQVPLHHLLQERQSKQELQKELDRIKDEFQSLRDEIQKGKPKVEFDDDPKAYVDDMGNKFATKEDLEKTLERRDEAAKAQALQNVLAEDARAISSKHRDFMDALTHTRRYFYNQHLMSGIPAEQIPQLISDTEINIAKDLLPKGQSPSEFVYQYAVENLGYKPKEAEKKQDTSKIDSIKRGQKASTPVPSGDAGTPSGKKTGDVFDEAFAESFAHMKK